MKYSIPIFIVFILYIGCKSNSTGTSDPPSQTIQGIMRFDSSRHWSNPPHFWVLDNNLYLLSLTSQDSLKAFGFLGDSVRVSYREILYRINNNPYIKVLSLDTL